jgi:NitT/TauT family transport system substrate-binding protein
MRRRIALSLLAAGAVAAGAPARAATPLAPLRIGVLAGDVAAEPYYAAASGIFAKHGIAATIEENTGGAAIISAILGGALDVGFSNLVSMVAAIQRGIPMMMLVPAGTFDSHDLDVALCKARGSALKTGADLKGKVVAVTSLSGLLSVGASAWIDQTGGDATIVHFIELPSPAMPAALKAGRIDAAMLNEPLITESRDDTQVLGDAFGAIAPRFTVGTFVTTKTWAQANADLAKRFVAAMVETARWANANRPATAKILTDVAKLDARTAATMARAAYGDAISADMIAPPLAASLKYGALKTPADVPALIADTQPYWIGIHH